MAPRVLGARPTDRWELHVLNQLGQQLPDDCTVVTGVSWSLRDDRGFVRDGEADLVVLLPRVGLCVLEVKGSREFRVDAAGRWLRKEQDGGREVPLAKSPAAQAAGNMHQLVRMVEQRQGGTQLEALYAYIVVYPQGRLATPLPAPIDPTTIVTAQELNQLGHRVRQALLARGRAERSRGFGVQEAREVAEILASQPCQIVKADTSVDARDDSGLIETLTRQQFAALQGLFRHPRVAVTGPAGSGKTELALMRLQALVESGRRAQYLCFNKNLARVIRARLPECEANVDSVDKFYMGIVRAAGLNVEVPHEEARLPSYFQARLPELVFQAVALGKVQPYDALIIDEGQDFSEEQLYAANELLAPDGEYAVFADGRQDVFSRGTKGYGAEVMFSLHHNCRNTERINRRTNRLTEMNIESMPGVPVGVEPLVHACNDAGAMASQAWKLASEWSDGPGTVVILSPYRLERSCMARSRKGHGLVLTEDVDRRTDDATVLFSTIKAFKGIEAASVVVVDLARPGQEQALGNDDVYVACTRARARLALMTADREVAAWLRSGAAAPPQGGSVK